MVKEIICVRCGEHFDSRKKVKKLKDGFYCKNCNKEKRKEHRNYLKKEIQKEDNLKKELKAKDKNLPLSPALRSIKRKPKISGLGLYITKEEKKERYLSFIKRGMSSEDAKKRIDNVCNEMVLLRDELKTEIKDKEELNERFKKAYEELWLK